MLNKIKLILFKEQIKKDYKNNQHYFLKEKKNLVLYQLLKAIKSKILMYWKFLPILVLIKIII